jgi:hypothetical protein
VLQKLADGVAWRHSLPTTPVFMNDAVRACLAFAARLAADDETLPLSD